VFQWAAQQLLKFVQEPEGRRWGTAGFDHQALVELDKHACATLKHNRLAGNVFQGDIGSFDGSP
jgi:site-specific DNA-cytosine methylase